MQIKYFDKKGLVSANNEAIRSDRNRSLHKPFVKKLQDDNFFPIVFSMVHNDVEMRVQVGLDAKGNTAYLDIPFETYEKLPSMDMPTSTT